ncbi:MAG: acetoin utilization protein AcuC [Nitrososphaera sp.]|uniref:acetoin utilization protein AcuC n=1 Tax=Nitrososphaera sp. TaxID=1971748 RepID=UPI0018462800|nr:acetoin utilization protein AcuC [Nitrososphaera sp.]NWG36582.1 acetoin utilization protein AcuC [Nitrososphaera sp.]
MGTAVFFGDELARYGFGGSHPFGTDRIYAFWSRLQAEKISNIVVEQPEIATEEAVLSFHDRDYVELVKMASKRCESVPLDRGDTPSFRGIFEATLYVVGSTLAALHMVMKGADRIGRKVENAFVPIAGLHHARRDSAGGFCVFNDVGVAVIQARKKYGIKRIAYVDIDAHHGDGVFYEFVGDPLLFFADIHEDGRYLYPGTGSADETGLGEAAGTKMNIPLLPEAGDKEFFDVFSKVETFIDSSKPELIFLNCGADSLAGDPITDLRYSAQAHAHAAKALRRIAEKHCAGRLIAVGGGGYNRTNIGSAWTEVVRVLAA